MRPVRRLLLPILLALAVPAAAQSPRADELSRIMDWVEQLNAVDTSNIAPMTSVADIRLPQRKDEVTDGNAPEKVLANAPDRQGDFFAVPKVVE